MMLTLFFICLLSIWTIWHIFCINVYSKPLPIGLFIVLLLSCKGSFNIVFSFLKIKVRLIYNDSGVQQSDSAIYMGVCVCVCMYIYMYVYIYICVCIYIYILFRFFSIIGYKILNTFSLCSFIDTKPLMIFKLFFPF